MTSAAATATALPRSTGASARPPVWLILATAAMALVLLGFAVAETSFKGHYLIDQGESLSLAGLVFILLAGLYLHRRQRLAASLPLVVPWLLYPVITQGDQLIDNLSINQMRVICHVLLAAIFATPVGVIVMAARYALAPAAGSRSMQRLAVALLTAEIWLAYRSLGTLMIITLIVMIAGVQLFGSRRLARHTADAPARRRRAGQRALAVLIIGVAGSAALYLVFKNRPGAYQGSPSFYMDPTQSSSGFPLDRIAVPGGAPAAPSSPEPVRAALAGYGRALEKLLAGYYILDRNYNYHFHNELFLRSTPLVPDYRAAGLGVIEEARRLRADADGRAAAARSTLADDDPLAALLDDLRAYVAFNFERAATLERMSGAFERTKAGLQHATHIYEGEGKFLGVRLAELLDKHRGVLQSSAAAPVTSEFTAIARSIHDSYANRIVGF